MYSLELLSIISIFAASILLIIYVCVCVSIHCHIPTWAKYCVCTPSYLVLIKTAVKNIYLSQEKKNYPL